MICLNSSARIRLKVNLKYLILKYKRPINQFSLSFFFNDSNKLTVNSPKSSHFHQQVPQRQNVKLRFFSCFCSFFYVNIFSWWKEGVLKFILIILNTRETAFLCSVYSLRILHTLTMHQIQEI